MNDTTQASSVSVKNFFETSSTVWADPSFTDWILPYHENEVRQNQPKQLKGFDLPERMNDSAIVKYLKSRGFDPKQNPVTLDQIKAKIEAQLHGDYGAMLTNGYANIFFLIGKDKALFTVRFHWRIDMNEWWGCVCRFGRFGGDRRVGDCVFCNIS